MTKSQNTKNEQQKDLCITSISVDMSTEEAPYNRIYAKPVEKQGDVLLCEFESANYDIEQKELKEQNAQLKEQINKCFLDVINRGTANTVKAVKEFGMPERIKELVEQNAQLKELLKECKMPLEVYNEMFGNKAEILQKIDEVLK